MSFTYRFRAALALGALSLACEFPVDDSKYRLEDSTNFDEIVSAFSSGEDCEACLESSCVDKINACAAIEGCTEFTKCVREVANPAGQARCSSGELDVPFAANVAYMDVVQCWIGCKSECAVGTNWDCLGGYPVPQPPSAEVTLRQSFTLLCEGGEVREAEVWNCDLAGNCRKMEVTDDNGSYTVDLPITVDGPAVGWSGFRRVVGKPSTDPRQALKAPHRLQRNLPIWSDHVEFTQLLSESCALMGALGLWSKDDTVDWNNDGAIGIQTFDCHTSGAEGVVLEIATAPDASIWYAASDGKGGVDYVGDSSTASGQGLALVGNLPEGVHHIVAKKSGKYVGTAEVKVPTDDLILYNVLPEQGD